MTVQLTRRLKLSVLILLGLSWSAAPGFAAQHKVRSGAPAHPAKTPDTELPAEIPLSVFSPMEGRNPFFPQSNIQPVKVTTTKGNKPAPVSFSGLVLNGIVPRGPLRTAMINSHTFEAGETGEVKLANGTKTLIKCEEIRADSVVIIVNGQRRELKYGVGL